MPVYPISSILVWEKISQYLGEFYGLQDRLLKGRNLDPYYTQIIMMESEILEFMFGFNPTESNINAVANYNYSLIKYIGEAKVIAGQGGTGGIVIPGSGVAATIIGMQLQFELGTTASPKTVNGVSVTLPSDSDISLTIPIENIVENSIEFSVGGTQIPSEAANNTVYINITYNSNNVVIDLIGFTFQTGNNYEINGLQFIPI